jgi:hypothetical protein
MSKCWQEKGIAFTFVFLCLVASALFEWSNCKAAYSARIDPTFDYRSSVLPDTISNTANRFNKVKYGKNTTGTTPNFETHLLSRIFNFFPDYHCSHNSVIWLIAGINGKSFDRFCQLADIPPPSIMA